MKLKVERVNPLNYGDELKELFLRNERPEFPPWFDRAYPISVRQGASSWILFDEARQVVGHIAAHPSTFGVDGREVHGALFSNLLVDREHRTFFPVVSLLRTAARDLRGEGVAFVYSDPETVEAVGVSRAAGMRQVGTVNRFAYPLSASGPMDLAARVYLGWLRLRRLKGMVVREVEAREAAEWTLHEATPGAPVSPIRHKDLYFMRWGSLDRDNTLAFEFLAAGERQVGAALLRTHSDHTATLITLRTTNLDYVTAASVALASLLRARGLRTLNASAVQESPFAAALTRGGFFLRDDPRHLIAAGLTDRGEAVVEGLGTSDLEKVDLD